MSQQVTSVCRATHCVSRRAKWRYGCLRTEILIVVDGEEDIAYVAAAQQQNSCGLFYGEIPGQMNRGGVPNRVEVSYDLNDYRSVHGLAVHDLNEWIFKDKVREHQLSNSFGSCLAESVVGRFLVGVIKLTYISSRSQ